MSSDQKLRRLTFGWLFNAQEPLGGFFNDELQVLFRYFVGRDELGQDLDRELRIGQLRPDGSLFR